ncbi:MAG: hypothetical protein QME87_12200 [Bacillota bacterium]|nr:hypothetical protein [Bacillota bacterium]
MPGGVVTVWPRNQLLVVEVGRPGGRRLVIPVALAVVEDLLRSWLDFGHLVGLPLLRLGLRRFLGRRGGRLVSLLEVARRPGAGARAEDGRDSAGGAGERAEGGKALPRGAAGLLGLGLDGLWRVWTDVRRSGRRTLLEVRPGDVEVCMRLW